jgi:hypothetical protein
MDAAITVPDSAQATPCSYECEDFWLSTRAMEAVSGKLCPNSFQENRRHVHCLHPNSELPVLSGLHH